MSSIDAIHIEGVTKAFKKHQRRKHFLTLKSTLIKDLWRKESAEENLYWALKGINVKVAQGETIGFIGSNGSGKSTLLKIIAGILKPTQGQVSFNGRLSALIELGAGFHPEISGRENIFINGIMLGLSKKEIAGKFDEIVDFAELWDFIDNPVRTYSSGMFMRLGFAVAVHVNPDILLIDEVLAVGDQSFVHKCLERIFDFKRRKKTIVIVSHDLGAIEKLCSRVVWISKGEQRQEGAPREVIDAYLMAIARREEERYASEHQQIREELEIQSDKLNSMDAEPESDPQHQPGNSKKRWGDRKVEITNFKTLDQSGAEKYVFKTGEAVIFRIEYFAHEEVEFPVFGIGFFLQDGTWCFGSNTSLEHKRIKSIQGKGWVQLQFPSLKFIQNSYLIDVAVHAEDGTPYDYHSRQYRIAFRSEIKDAGIYRPDHTWHFCPHIEIVDDKTSVEE